MSGGKAKRSKAAAKANRDVGVSSVPLPVPISSPTIADWLIAAVGIGGVILGLVAAFTGVLVLFFVGFVMLVGSFLVQRVLRSRRAQSP